MRAIQRQTSDGMSENSLEEIRSTGGPVAGGSEGREDAPEVEERRAAQLPNGLILLLLLPNPPPGSQATVGLGVRSPFSISATAAFCLLSF